ncbi:MAG TPA: hypothetical protein DDW76_06050 [Cyanobacteria bacterium UBA11369]|nr:hypothetical protein [Cyanobacteria bacterium UBA11371]HBE18259.1 hypothetical protein [Cyanobacteria bacterium UBA11367]HBE31987.1 hypothetical protein [Cyanobacteria bacterium UBA11368]HBE48368.1 hypothetical protein [Cyanobacteria bacterium UBA11369]
MVGGRGAIAHPFLIHAKHRIMIPQIIKHGISKCGGTPAIVSIPITVIVIVAACWGDFIVCIFLK